MSRRFFWQMVCGLLCVALLLFSVAHEAAFSIASWMREIKPADQSTLRHYSEQAEQAFVTGDREGLLQLTRDIEQTLGVWSAIQAADGTLHTHKALPDDLAEMIGFQRHIYWPVHAFMTRVMIGFPLQEGNSFVIELPQSMHPRPNTAVVHTLLTLVVPSLVLIIFCWLLYRYLMRPLEALNQGTLKLAAGDLDARVGPQIPRQRRDEITQLAGSFDSMAERLQRLVTSQRQLLGDLSHELRTPLTRIELALELCRDDKTCAGDIVDRLSRETGLMHQLVDDALTLAWLDGEARIVRTDSFNLSTLLDLLCEDAAFEYPDHIIRKDYAAECPVVNSNQRALAQSIENVLRNALKYSPVGSEITLCCELTGDQKYRIEISDQGQGVAGEQLEKIFKPFFRTDKARSREQGGFGLGLALVKRQLEAIGGSVRAEQNVPQGLRVILLFPATHNEQEEL